MNDFEYIQQKIDIGSVNSTESQGEDKYKKMYEEEIVNYEYRNSVIIDIERDVIQLSEMFIDLNKLVKDQGINIDIIDDFIDITLELAQEAEKEIVEAESFQKEASTLKYFAIGIPIILAVAIYEIAK